MTIQELNSSDRLRIEWCISTLEVIAADSLVYRQTALMIIDALKRVLQPNLPD